MPVGNSDIFTQDFSSVRLPTRDMMYACLIEQMNFRYTVIVFCIVVAIDVEYCIDIEGFYILNLIGNLLPLSILLWNLEHEICW
jgi:hypothetical protein